MKSNTPPYFETNNKGADLQKKLQSCRSKVERLEQFARGLIDKHNKTKSILNNAVDGIVIPQIDNTALRSQPDAGASPAAVCGSETILVVEDEDNH